MLKTIFKLILAIKRYFKNLLSFKKTEIIIL